MPIVQCLTCGNPIYLDETTYANYQGRVVCPDCKGNQDVLIQNQSLVNSNLTPNVFAPIQELWAWDIPMGIMEDVIEASIDLVVRVHKSCVVMCRRCVQAVLLSHGIPDDLLSKMIEAAKAQGVLTEELFQTATAVRFFGNAGAHPNDQLLASITPLQATLALEVVKEILKSVYPRRPEAPVQEIPGSQGL